MKFYEGALLYDVATQLSYREINSLTISASKINKEIKDV